jgi:ribosome-associated protein
MTVNKDKDQNSELKLLNEIAQIIFDKKGMNILVLDVRKISSITDYVVIAEGAVDRHVVAIAKTIHEELKKKGEVPLSIEGLQNGDWVVIDYVNVMVHLFMPGYRDKYQLEQLWKEGEIVDVNINVGSSDSASMYY